jgi:peroxiredoxin
MATPNLTRIPVKLSTLRFARTLAGTAALALSLALTSCGGTSTGGAEAPASGGGSAPDFSLPSVEGGTVRLSDYAGKVVLINFWSTTCDPCMVEMPHLVEMYKKNKERGLVVLAVSLDGPESLGDVKRVVHDKEMIFPVLLDQETTVVARYNPKRDMPFSVVIDKGGNIVHKRAGYTVGDEKVLTAEVEKALQ